MTPIEKQLLINQMQILYSMGGGSNCDLRIKETEELLKPKSKEEDCCPMPPRDEKCVLQKKEVTFKIDGKEQQGMSSMGIKIGDFVETKEEVKNNE